MLKLVLTLIVAAGVAVLPSPADACGNEVELTLDDYVRIVHRAEKLLEAGQYRRAQRALRHVALPNARLRARAADVLAVIRLRAPRKPEDVQAAAVHFKARSEAPAGKADLRFRAWLAEAYVATGKLAEARAILLELRARDLMPDAFAYLALAKTSAGAERYEAWKACRTRARNKDLCTLPDRLTSSATRPAS